MSETTSNNKKMRILVIEDDEQLARLLELELLHCGYQVDKISDGSIGLKQLQEIQYDLILLDIMLPGIDGLEICRKVRLFSNIPIIMLTAKDRLDDKIKGLDCGADDYVTKPFETEELLARVRVCLRRNEVDNHTQNELCACDLLLNSQTREVKRAGKLLSLSKTEFDLLEYLLINKNIVLTRDTIMNHVWGYDYIGDSNIVDVYIRYLRGKVDDMYERKLIYTCRGVGYSLKENGYDT